MLRIKPISWEKAKAHNIIKSAQVAEDGDYISLKVRTAVYASNDKGLHVIWNNGGYFIRAFLPKYKSGFPTPLSLALIKGEHPIVDLEVTRGIVTDTTFHTQEHTI